MTQAQAPIRTQNVPAAVAAALRGRIASGDWPAGARIPGNRDLAATYGVSMGSVREAISSLASEGLIESRAGSGTFVATTLPADPSPPPSRPPAPGPRPLLDRAEVEELLEAREIIELQMVALAARRATPAAVARLHALVDRMAEGARDPARYSEADVEFHMALAQAARNRVLIEAMTTIRSTLRRDMELSAEMGARRHGTLQYSIDSHRRIVDAVERRDAAAARAEMEAIMSRHHRFVLSLYGDAPPDSGSPDVGENPVPAPSREAPDIPVGEGFIPSLPRDEHASILATVSPDNAAGVLVRPALISTPLPEAIPAVGEGPVPSRAPGESAPMTAARSSDGDA